MTDLTRFDDHVRRAARGFLQTVVLVDDQASMDPQAEDIPFIPDPGFESASAAADIEEPAPRPKAILNAKELVDAFSNHGLICAVFRPTVEQSVELEDELLLPATRADIVVLDWVLHDDAGSSALALIESLVQADSPASSGRLRLIAIYTGENDLEKIMLQIREKLGSVVEGAAMDTSTSGHSLTNGGLRIAVIAKEGVRVPENATWSAVAASDLPSVLIDHFMELTNGIVPTFALGCLTVIRENAHHVLRRFNAGLDGPFLSHRSFTQPLDAEDFAISLIGAELLSLLDSAEVANSVGSGIIEVWIRDRLRLGEFVIDDSTSITREDFAPLVNNIDSEPQESAKRAQKRLKNQGSLTRPLSANAEEANALDHEFARLSCLARNGPDPFEESIAPCLTLGTILKSNSSEGNGGWDYWLSVQPACDSVRVDSPRNFPLMPLMSVPLDEKFEITALDTDGGFLNLMPKPKFFQIKSVIFNPGLDERVRAERSESEYLLRGDNETNYIWIGQLKPHHAQRYASLVAGMIGRPGLDEYDWLRRKR